MSTALKISDISIIIPTLNEQRFIGETIQKLIPSGVEIIISDGGSNDRTVEIAEQAGARVIHAPRGRAVQMNAGATEARGSIFLFLHADTTLPQGFEHLIKKTLRKHGVSAGAFLLSIKGEEKFLRFVETAANIRSILLKMPYGDQALFVSAHTFQKIGGFPEIAIMEDLGLIKKAKKLGRIEMIRSPIQTSARRWQTLGPIKTTLINQMLLIGYLIGIRPDRLAQWYGSGQKR